MKVAIIGAGAMGGAVASGLVLSKGLSAEQINVSNPSEGKLSPLEKMGIKVTTSNTEAAVGADVVIIAVKPWVLPSVADELKDVLNGAHEVCVIAAGISSAEMDAFFSGSYALNIAMPNTAMSQRRSMTFIVPVRGESRAAKELFGYLGSVMEIDERWLPGAMALASCGIAYALRYIRAAAEGGVELGFRAQEAQEIVVRTIEGAAALLSQPGAHAEAEIDKVTTPGGFTIRGLNAMEEAGFTNAVIKGLKASVK